MDNEFFMLTFVGVQAGVTLVGVVVAIIFGWLNCSQNKLKRQNDLFDKRYEFYKRVENIWIETRYDNDQPLEIEILIPLASEASYLFGTDISDHILGLEGKSHDGSPYFANTDFSHPFEKYLKLQ